MKHLYMKQQVFSWIDRFTVKDGTERDCYQVEGDVIVIGGKKLHILDMQGRELAMVQQKLFSFLPKFFVFVNGQQVAQINKKFALFGSKYTVDGPGWEVSGRIASHDYSITDGSGEIAGVHKAWFSWGDSYEIAIADRADEVLALAVVLAIDCVLAAEAEASSSASVTVSSND